MEEIPIQYRAVWDMAVSVFQEMNAGMGSGMMQAILSYCALTGVKDEMTMKWYFDVMRLALPSRSKKEES